MGKYYAVRKGRHSGIYFTWPECSNQVTGFPGAIYKSFSTLDEAKSFLRGDWVRSHLDELRRRSQSCEESKTPIEESRLLLPDVLKRSRVYTDGSCKDTIGGYGIVILRSSQDPETVCGRVPIEPCTNQKAELYAIHEALLHTEGQILLRTDSQYAINCLTSWMPRWKINGWRTSSGQSVENRELLETISSLMHGRDVLFEHVRGHQGHRYNEMADYLANEGRCK